MAAVVNPQTPMPITEFFVITICIAFQAAVTGFDWLVLGEGFGFAFCGAVLLTFYRREQTVGEKAFKTLAATIAGFISGAVAVEYFAIARPQYRWFTYFLSGVLSLTLIRALLTFTEQNGTDICRDLLQRLLKLQTPDERRKRRAPRLKRPPEGRFITHPDDGEGNDEQ